MIKDVSINRGRYNFTNPEEYQVCVQFYTDNGCVSSVLPLEEAEHLLYWDDDNPVDLLREVLKINKDVYLYSSCREELEKLLVQCTREEKNIQITWLEKKKTKLMNQIRALENEVRRIEEKIRNVKE